LILQGVIAEIRNIKYTCKWSPIKTNFYAIHKGPMINGSIHCEASSHIQKSYLDFYKMFKFDPITVVKWIFLKDK